MEDLKTKILVVDDDLFSLRILLFNLKSLKEKGCEIMVAHNGEKALNDAFKLLPDLILLDVNLPDMDGFEVCKRLKSDDKTREIPIIFLSGFQDSDSKVAGFKSGGIDYITKPYEKEETFIRIETQLKIHLLNNRLEEERRKSEKLLLNILPHEIAKELKEKGRVTPQYYDSVSVLFTDFKGFTLISELMTPEELINEIDFYFKKFDEITSRYGVEKIKTIGDAYLCVAGLPIRTQDHAHKIVLAAIEMRDFILTTKAKREAEGKSFFEMRIGIDTGSVVAGVVGNTKFAYDIWGDTVNIAARMESNGEPGKVNISESTFNLVKNDFSCFNRGMVSVKNKGKLNMYFVEPADFLS